MKLIPAVSKRLDYSNGFNVHQKCLQKHLKTWDVENETDMDEEARDGVVMSIRSLVSQMQNHRRKDRSVPKMWQSKFQTVFDKVPYNQPLAKGGRPILPSSELGEDSDDDDDDSDEVEAIEPDPPKPKLMVTISDTEDELEDLQKRRDDLFKSEDAILDKLLNVCGKRLRRKTNPTEAATTTATPTAAATAAASTTKAPTTTALSWDEVMKLGAGTFAEKTSPDSFSRLKAELKEGDGKKKAMKSMKAMKAMKATKASKKSMKAVKVPMKAMKTMKATKAPINTWKAFLNREHSRVWHPVFNEAKAAGLFTATQCATRASDKARSRTAELRAERIQGLHSQYV